MLCISLRSSSLNDWLTCPHKFFLGYTLGINLDANSAATKGNVLHKAMELLARHKVCKQENRDSWYDEDTKTTIPVETITPKFAFEYAWDYYQKRTNNSLGESDKLEIKEWAKSILTKNGGDYSPLNRDILAVERFFDFPVNEDWAYYDFEVKGKRFQGQLTLRGTLDLITKVSDDTIEYVDCKSGARICWRTRKQKTFDNLPDDPQLLLYLYVIRHLYPEYPYIISTLHFVKEGGPFPIPFGESHYIKARNLLRDEFTKIKENELPQLIINNRERNFHCRFCQFGRTKPGSTKTYCKYFQDEIKLHGLEYVTENYINLDRLFLYEGGGASRQIERD